MLFISLVPHAQIEYGPREESTFCRTQKEADDEQSGETLSETHEGANDAPHESNSRKPEPWSREFEDDVTRDIEQGIADKVDGQCGEVLIPGLHFEWW